MEREEHEDLGGEAMGVVAILWVKWLQVRGIWIDDPFGSTPLDRLGTGRTGFVLTMYYFGVD